MQKFSPGENFHLFRSLHSGVKFLSHSLFSCVNEYMHRIYNNMATLFATWVKIYSTEYFYNAKVVAGLGEKFVQQKIFNRAVFHS